MTVSAEVEKRIWQKIGDVFRHEGLTQSETVIVMARFLGSVIAEAPDEAHQKAQLAVTRRATQTMYGVLRTLRAKALKGSLRPL